jgi:hypothetical protein
VAAGSLLADKSPMSRHQVAELAGDDNVFHDLFLQRSSCLLILLMDRSCS